jgi:excisionase family DNA binding protein
MYRLVSSGEIESVRIGRLRRVPKDAISAYITTRLSQRPDAA